VWDSSVPEDIKKTYISDFSLSELVEVKPISQPQQQPQPQLPLSEFDSTTSINNKHHHAQCSSPSSSQQYGLFSKVKMPKVRNIPSSLYQT
jgi:hypothetical protein